MRNSFNATAFWADVAAQNRPGLRGWFETGAVVRWHNTNEQFTLEQYLTANCDYPGDWRGEVERVEPLEGGRLLTITQVWTPDNSIRCRVTSFFTFGSQGITHLDEYWGDVGEPPAWRSELKLSVPIH